MVLEREGEREFGCSRWILTYLTLYIHTYMHFLHLSQAACYDSRLSLDLDALLSFPTAQPEKKNPRQTLPGEIPGLGSSC